MVRIESERRVKEFLDEQIALGKRGQSLRNNRHRIPHFLGFLEENQLHEGQINLKVAYDYQSYLIERGRLDGTDYKAVTVRCYLTAALAYVDWLKAQKIVSTNPFRSMKKIKQEVTLPKDLPKEEKMSSFLDHLAGYLDEKHLKRRLLRYRTHVMAEVLYSSAMRLSELGNLRPGDVDHLSGRLFIKEGKGGRSRYAQLGEYASKVLSLYTQKVRPVIINFYPLVDPSRLFLSSPSTLAHSLNGELSRCAKQVGIQIFTSHRFRHSVGYHLLRSGCSLRYIQQILGHTHIHTSEIYTKVDGEKLEQMLCSCHPRSCFSNVRS